MREHRWEERQSWFSVPLPVALPPFNHQLFTKLTEWKFNMTKLMKTPALSYNGLLIHEKGEKLSLTDMWKAAGVNQSKRPYEWSRKEGSAFIEAVSINLNAPVERIYNAERGKQGKTWGHWQIGLAYAKYLSPEFHMWCNQVVRSRMEGKLETKQTGLTDYDKSIIGNMIKNCAGVVIREELLNLLPALVEPMVQARLAESNFLIRHGKTAGQIWKANNLPRLKNGATWLGNRLQEMGCSIEHNGRADFGTYSARLFDPDRATICLRNGLLHKTKIYASERMGQGKLRLVAK